MIYNLELKLSIYRIALKIVFIYHIVLKITQISLISYSKKNILLPIVKIFYFQYGIYLYISPKLVKKNVACHLSVANESFMRVNQCRTRKKIFTPIIEITEYSVAILRQRREEERVWLAAAKLAENRSEFTSMHTALTTMRNIIKARRDERYWSVRRNTNGK